MKMRCIDSPCELISLVIVVEIVLKLCCKKDSYEDHLVGVEVVQSEIFDVHVIAVDVDDGENEAFGGIFSIFV